MRQFIGMVVIVCAVVLLGRTSGAEELADVVWELVEEVERHPESADAQKRAGGAYLLLAREVGENPAREVFGAMADFHLDQAVQLDPDDMEALEWLGETAVLNMDPSKAAAVFEELVRRQTDPAEGKNLVQLHTCYQWLTDPWRGVAFYRSQLERMPDWPQVKFLMASFLLDMDRAEALDILLELASSPGTPEGLRATVRAALKEEL
ncbi:hypothetical protein [Desulfovibrio sp. Fe33]|uniref:hypothetical protein n=1 Tax=Desulfovibrio sp. Fe33 TaxID=3020842 RepID=UPI00234DA91C|nr:hypothetical protein [Desulfovibrio sp. Fe33]